MNEDHHPLCREWYCPGRPYCGMLPDFYDEEGKAKAAQKKQRAEDACRWECPTETRTGPTSRATSSPPSTLPSTRGRTGTSHASGFVLAVKRAMDLDQLVRSQPFTIAVVRHLCDAGYKPAHTMPYVRLQDALAHALDNAKSGPAEPAQDPLPVRASEQGYTLEPGPSVHRLVDLLLALSPSEQDDVTYGLMDRLDEGDGQWGTNELRFLGARPRRSLPSTLERLRTAGWRVRSHHEALTGESCVYWLFSRGEDVLCGESVHGTGATDEDALAQVLAKIQKLDEKGKP